MHNCFVIAVDLHPMFKHVKGCRIFSNEVDIIWDKVLKLIILLKSSNNRNKITAGVAEVKNDAAITEPIAEE